MKQIKVAARKSPLSLVQVKEVFDELKQTHPDITYALDALETTGDLNKQISLRGMEKTDFFTREIDRHVLTNECDVGIHSAKDLPDPLSEGLCLFALTKGVDPSDVLVLPMGVTLSDLPPEATIATSSKRREEAISSLRQDLTFCDIRGTIQERLDQLNQGSISGVVIAEAALIRLGLTHLNRIKLPGKTTPLQGQLAIIGRQSDSYLKEIFSCIDSRTLSHA